MRSVADQDVYWHQCQHQSWYFLPWHRGYLAALGAIVRKSLSHRGTGGLGVAILELASPTDRSAVRTRIVPTIASWREKARKVLPVRRARRTWSASILSVLSWIRNTRGVRLNDQTVSLNLHRNQARRAAIWPLGLPQGRAIASAELGDCNLNSNAPSRPEGRRSDRRLPWAQRKSFPVPSRCPPPGKRRL